MTALGAKQSNLIALRSDRVAPIPAVRVPTIGRAQIDPQRTLASVGNQGS
jgi:hypothetical protein